MSSLVSLIALSHGVQSCRLGYKPEFIIARSAQAARLCEAYGERAFEVAMRFAELYGSSIVSFGTKQVRKVDEETNTESFETVDDDESMARIVKDSAEKLEQEWYKAFVDMIPKPEFDSSELIAVVGRDFEALEKENAELKATIELLSKQSSVDPTHGEVASSDSEQKADSTVVPDANTESKPGAKPVDLSQIPVAVLGITKALKTTLVELGCATVADVVKLHAEKPLESQEGIGPKSQQMILDAIAKLG